MNAWAATQTRYVCGGGGLYHGPGGWVRGQPSKNKLGVKIICEKLLKRH